SIPCHSWFLASRLVLLQIDDATCGQPYPGFRTAVFPACMPAARRMRTRLPRKTAGIARIAAAVILGPLSVLCLWLVFLPPNLLRVGSGYAAKIVCSNVFLAGRDPDEVLAIDVQAPGLRCSG